MVDDTEYVSRYNELEQRTVKKVYVESFCGHKHIARANRGKDYRWECPDCGIVFCVGEQISPWQMMLQIIKIDVLEQRVYHLEKRLKDFEDAGKGIDDVGHS